MNIETVHFLIHPGFCTVGEAADDDYLPLLDSYLDYAERLQGDAAMLVFSHADNNQLVRDFKAGIPYAVFLDRLSQAVAGKAMIFPDQYHFFTLGEGDRIRGKLEWNGWRIDREADSYALGETLGCCVSDGAQSLNITLGLIKPTIVLPHLTEMGIIYPDKEMLAAFAEVFIRGRDRIILRVP